MKWSYGFLLTLRELELNQSIVDVEFDYATERLKYAVRVGGRTFNLGSKLVADRGISNALVRHRLSRTIIQLPVLYDNIEHAVAALDWERQLETIVTYYNLREGGELSYYLRAQSDVTRIKLNLNEHRNDYNLLLTAKGVREGYGFAECPGSHMIITEPGGDSYRASWWDCDCHEFQTRKDCLHKRMVHVYSQHRIEFKDITQWITN